MIEVSADVFFSLLGPMDVHPSVAHGDRYDELRGYRSIWRTRHGHVVGQSDGGTHLAPHRYFVDAALLSRQQGSTASNGHGGDL